MGSSFSMPPIKFFSMDSSWWANSLSFFVMLIFLFFYLKQDTFSPYQQLRQIQWLLVGDLLHIHKPRHVLLHHHSIKEVLQQLQAQIFLTTFLGKIKSSLIATEIRKTQLTRIIKSCNINESRGAKSSLFFIIF